ncbi:MAG: exostosin family protein [Leptolyngbya sp. SIO1E4]|nr:exostosin family protein [Leptolyngbya sp. SIO1E4]
MKIKIFSDQQFLHHDMEPDPIHYPFWLETQNSSKYSWLNLYDKYIDVGHTIFESADIEEADFAVMPPNWRTIRGDSWRSKINQNAEHLGIQFSQVVKRANKPLIVFFSGDCSDEDIPMKDAIVFRQSAYCSRFKANDFSLPAFCEDAIEFYFDNQLPVRHKQEKPIVGFCGFLRSDSFKRKIQTALYYVITLVTRGRVGVSPYKGEILRSNAIELLSKSHSVETNFLIRRSQVFFENSNLEYKQKVRSEFVQNIIGSDYVLCCRGSGNYSIRLYETLACGRIPIFIDTDCVLPYDFAIDWKKYCVWIDENDLPNIAEKIADFHEKLSAEEFIDLQYNCRKLWKEWLSPEGFYSNLYRHFGLSN